MKWINVKDIYDQYQKSKGFFRQLFNTNSDFMNFLGDLLKDKPLEEVLNQKNQYQLLKRILSIPDQYREKLSYRLAGEIALSCVEENLKFYELIKLLHRSSVFTERVFQSIASCDDQTSVIEELLIVFKSKDRLTPKILHLEKTAIECFLGEHFIKLGNKEKAYFWYTKAIKKNQLIEATSFPKTTVAAEILFSFAKAYEQGEIVSKNIHKAAQFYQRAGELDHKQALFRLGELYQAHSEITRDDSKAFQCYLRSAELGVSQAIPILNRLARDNKELRNILSKNSQTLWKKCKVNVESSFIQPSSIKFEK